MVRFLIEIILNKENKNDYNMSGEYPGDLCPGYNIGQATCEKKYYNPGLGF